MRRKLGTGSVFLTYKRMNFDGSRELIPLQGYDLSLLGKDPLEWSAFQKDHKVELDRGQKTRDTPREVVEERREAR